MDLGFFLALLDVNQPLVTVAGYPMSAVELFGTLFNLVAVYLMARRQIWTWPLGIVGVVLFAALFYQIRLYGDFIEQIYYLGASFYGWWLWRQPHASTSSAPLGFSPFAGILTGLLITLVGGLLLGVLLIQLPTLLPAFFSEPPSYPYLDAVTTTGSFVAMVLEARRRIEAWIYWTVLNLLGIWLYIVKGVPLVAGVYGCFLALGLYGYWTWWVASRKGMGGALSR